MRLSRPACPRTRRLAPDQAAITVLIPEDAVPSDHPTEPAGPDVRGGFHPGSSGPPHVCSRLGGYGAIANLRRHGRGSRVCPCDSPGSFGRTHCVYIYLAGDWDHLSPYIDLAIKPWVPTCRVLFRRWVPPPARNQGESGRPPGQLPRFPPPETDERHERGPRTRRPFRRETSPHPPLSLPCGRGRAAAAKHRACPSACLPACLTCPSLPLQEAGSPLFRGLSGLAARRDPLPKGQLR